MLPHAATAAAEVLDAAAAAAEVGERGDLVSRQETAADVVAAAAALFLSLRLLLLVFLLVLDAVVLVAHEGIGVGGLVL